LTGFRGLTGVFGKKQCDIKSRNECLKMAGLLIQVHPIMYNWKGAYNMMTTIEKVKRLQQYLAADSSAVDPVLDMVIDKLLAREIERVRKLKNRLTAQLAEFEDNYALNSKKFYARYEKGELGDSMDFVEWSATVEMLTNAEKRITLLETASS
jgi:hypothetical protein